MTLFVRRRPNAVDLGPGLAIEGKHQHPVPAAFIGREERNPARRIRHGRFVVHDDIAVLVLLRPRFLDVPVAGEGVAAEAVKYCPGSTGRHFMSIDTLDGAARQMDRFSSAAAFDGFANVVAAASDAEIPVRPARTWLLRIGWRRHGLLEL